MVTRGDQIIKKNIFGYKREDCLEDNGGWVKLCGYNKSIKEVYKNNTYMIRKKYFD